MSKDEALKMAIEKAMIPTNKAMQQSQSNPVFLAQGSKLVAGHEGVFVEDKNLKEIVSYHETHCAELDNVIEQLQAENAKLEERIKLALSLLDVNDYTDTHLMGNCITLAKKACKEALEQPTTQEEKDWYASGFDDGFLYAQPDQEPVAWMETIWVTDEEGLQSQQKVLHDYEDFRSVPLYTHPKEWQGLSDDELKDFWIEHQPVLSRCPMQFARAIEAKLKEKNNE